MHKLKRREFLQRIQGLAVTILAPFVLVKEALASRFPTRTVEKKTFIFDPATGEVIWKDKNSREKYFLKIEGMVEKPHQLSYEELKNLKSDAQVSDFHCVEGWTVPNVRWSGFRFDEILKLVKPLDGAEYVTFHALGETAMKPRRMSHYVESFKLESLLDPQQHILMALNKDGSPLSHDRGGPLRVIAPYRLAYKSIKFVYRIEFTNKRQLGWWTLANSVYSWEALVPRSRLRK